MLKASISDPRSIANIGVGVVCVLWLAILFSSLGCSKPPAKPAYPNSFQVGHQLIREREGWVAEDFFEDQTYLKICDAISLRDDPKLQELIKDKIDLNQPGTNGFTLLYWAFVEHNLSAFKILLERGANADLVLSKAILGKEYSFVANDNILFTSLHCMRDQFCHAALPYSKDVNRRRGGKDNLLHAHFQTQLGYQGTVQALIDAGVDVNAVGSFGYTPCHYATSDKPELCIPLIEAGSDPSIRNDQGHTVLEMLERQRARLAAIMKPEATTIASYDKVIAWLKARESAASAQPE